MIKEISDFLYSFKNNTIEAKQIIQEHKTTINNYANKLKENDLYQEYEENILTILGYSYRLDDKYQQLFFTFQEAVYAIDLDKLMRNDDSLNLNIIVYIFVLDFILKDLDGELDEEYKNNAIKTYKVIEEKKAKENKKYHMYQN